MTARRPGVVAVARAAGVSASTVSNAFNRPERLSPELRERVLRAAAELGYGGPDPVARSLRSGRAGALGVVFRKPLAEAFEDPATAQLLRGVSDVDRPRAARHRPRARAPGRGAHRRPGRPQRRRRRPDRLLAAGRRSARRGDAPSPRADRHRRLTGDRVRRARLRRDRRPRRRGDRGAPPARPRPPPARDPEPRSLGLRAARAGRHGRPGAGHGQRAEGAPGGLRPGGAGVVGGAGRAEPFQQRRVRAPPRPRPAGPRAGRHGAVRVQRPARARRAAGRPRARPVGPRRSLDRRLRRHGAARARI